MLDKTEMVGNVPIQKLAYEEFESSIISIKNPNKDVRFAIFLYDVTTLTGHIKTTVIIGGKYSFVTEPPIINLDFYGNNYDHLVNFLKDFVSKKQVKDNEIHRHFFITWGHGTGLSFFAQDDINEMRSNLKSLSEEKTAFNNYYQLINSLRFLRSQLSLEDSQINYLEILSENFLFPDKKNPYDLDKRRIVETTTKLVNRSVTGIELVNILSKGLEKDFAFQENKKIDFIMCLTCYTQMIETGNTLKSIAKILIAPETTITHFGYNYKKLFKLFCSKPEIDETQVANCLVNNYLAKFDAPEFTNIIKKNENIGVIPYRQLVSFSIIRLDQYADIIKSIRLLVDYILDTNDTITVDNSPVGMVRVLALARLKCMVTTSFVSSDTSIIDFNNLIMEFYRFHGQFAGEPLRIFDKLMESYDENGKFIIAGYFPARFSHMLKHDQIQTLWAGLFGVFLPLLRNLSPAELNMYNYIKINQGKIGFWKETRWDELILKIEI